jgi:hypothetical protein
MNGVVADELQDQLLATGLMLLSERQQHKTSKLNFATIADGIER